MNSKKIIYLDNAATTKVKKETVDVMNTYFERNYGNPSSIYEFGMESGKEMERGRAVIAKMLNCSPEEIYFTSGGTESDNWAIKGLCFNENYKGKHIITSVIEHPAVYNTTKYLEKMGYEISYIEVNKSGLINLRQLQNAIRKDTILISVMTANNELGTIQPIYDIGKIAAANNILFHTDAVQAFAHIPIDVRRGNINLLSASSHKFGGPKGVGFLYVEKGVKIQSFIHGGEQEKGLRAGTGNVSGIAGMTTAAEYHFANMDNIMRYESMLRNYMIKRILQEIPFSYLNGHASNRLPGNVNISFAYADGGAILEMLDMEGICVSTGSACSSKSSEPSRTLKAIGLDDDMAHSSVRFTLSESNTREEIDYCINVLKDVVEQLRGKTSKYREKLVEFHERF